MSTSSSLVPRNSPTTAVTAAADGEATVRRPRRAGRRHAVLGIVLVAAPALVVLAFVGVPVLNAAAFSLGFTGGLNQPIADIGQGTVTGPTLDVYTSLFRDATFVRDLSATVLVTVVSTVATVVVALLVAVLLRLRGGVAGTLLSSLSVVPMFVPVVISSWAVLTFLDAQGLVRSLGEQVGVALPVWGYTLVAVVYGSVWTSLPFAVLMIAGALQGVPDALVDAARDSGAGTVRVVWEVLLPLARVPLIIATTFTLIGVLGSFTVPYFTGPNAPTMLGVDISTYFQAYNRPQQSTAMAFIVFAIAAAASVFYLRATVASNASSLRSGR